MLTSLSLGRSAGRGSFSIWTHQLKGRNWTDSFVASGAPKGIKGIPAVTLQAGEQWLGIWTLFFRCYQTNWPLDVYKAASEQRVIVVGGAARTVGAAGGWLTGGGHSPFASDHGLGVDSKCLCQWSSTTSNMLLRRSP